MLNDPIGSEKHSNWQKVNEFPAKTFAKTMAERLELETKYLPNWSKYISLFYFYFLGCCILGMLPFGDVAV